MPRSRVSAFTSLVVAAFLSSDAGLRSEEPGSHWAFKAPAHSTLPASAYRNPIDAFIDAQRQKHGLKPQTLADKRLLLRRVYLDLIGLPPTREEQEAFLADQSTDAYEKVVDRLLASKQYGERWGRHWMDVWRYSDPWGLGAEVRNSQKHIWHWRDWIIESLNADKGYDQMVREMLAADELYPTDLDRLRANGFLARQYFIFNRNTWLEETVEHTSKAFLGITMNCTKCHDHKYDPIAQQDFYRFRAFFEPYQVRADMVAGEADFAKDGISRVFDCNLDTPTHLFTRGDEKQPQKDKPIAPGVPKVLSFDKVAIVPVTLPPEAHSPGLRAIALENHLRVAEKQIATAQEALVQATKTLADAERRSKLKESKSVAADKPLVSDNFASANSEVWEIKTGQWKHAAGKLIQSQEGSSRAVLRLKTKAPSDFQARLKFTPTGGQMWKSVGLSFDVAENNEALVYLSAVAGGSKVQIAYKQGANYVYPAEAAQSRAVKLKEPQELLIRVRGQLINVDVNGEQALSYRLPIARRAGAIEVITYDAKAEFTLFELSALTESIVVREPGKSTPASAVVTVDQAKLMLAAAEKALAAARLQPDALKARHAADLARYQQPPASNAKQLARSAARAERLLAVARADEAVTRAEIEFAATKKPEIEKKLTAAKDALTKGRKDAENPSENFTPLSGSLKTPENNLESEASRSKPYPTTSTGRRSALAQWLTDARNPLTARVAVNHIWARHFGKPLVATVFDFGRKGAAPTHPELLDWLAVEFRESGWSMKKLHRLMVTSETYRLSSSSKLATDADTQTAKANDAENRYYWRMNPVRMEAEVIRDSLLHVSGELDLAMGGPPVPIGDEASRRRSMYFVHSHNDRQQFLETFDNASVLECYRRAESIVPQQALALENSKLPQAAAEKIARRIVAKSDADFVRAAFGLVLGSAPTASEQKECEEALRELGTLAEADRKPEGAMRARANLVQALLNHNDFVTIR